MKQTEFDTDHTRHIVCPYCGYVNRDSWEITDDDGELECGICDKEFSYTRNIHVDYSTSKIEPKEETK